MVLARCRDACRTTQPGLFEGSLLCGLVVSGLVWGVAVDLLLSSASSTSANNDCCLSNTNTNTNINTSMNTNIYLYGTSKEHRCAVCLSSCSLVERKNAVLIGAREEKRNYYSVVVAIAITITAREGKPLRCCRLGRVTLRCVALRCREGKQLPYAWCGCSCGRHSVVVTTGL